MLEYSVAGANPKTAVDVMGRTRSFVGSTSYGYLYQASAMLVGLWLTPFYLRSLGQRDYGLWLIGLQVLTILLLIDFGVVAILPRDVARLVGKMKTGAGPEELIGLIRKTTSIALWQTLIVTAASVAAYFLWPRISPEIRGPLRITILAFCLSFPLRLYAGILEGLQDIKFLSQLRMALWAFVTAMTVVLLLFGWRLYALAAGWSFNVVAFQLAAFLRLRVRNPHLVRIGDWLDPDRLTWRDFTRGSWVSIGQVAQLLRDGTSLIALASVAGPSVVVIYTCTSKLMSVLANQPQLLVLSALPGLSEIRTGCSKGHLQVVTTSLAQAMLLLSGGILGAAFAVNESFVKVWVGPQFFAGTLLTALLVLTILSRHMDLAFAQALFAMGHERALGLKALADGVITTTGAIVFVYWFGLYGPALGQLAGVLLAGVPVGITLFCREFETSPRQALAPYIPYFVYLGVAGAAGKWLESYVKPHNYLQVGGVAVSVLILYFALVIPHAMRTPLGAYIRMTLAHLRASVA